MPAVPSTWLGDDEAKPAPEPLSRVQALVNTIELESGDDRLANPADARPWLISQGLLASDAAISEPDLVLIRGAREALRAMLVHNAGGPATDEAALAPLREIAASGQAKAELDDDGTVRLDPAGDSVRARLLGVLLIVKDAQRDGTWQHLKACANDDCLWAFYDRSKNHGGTWCDMATCGNKLKNREFRARRRDAAKT
jgi:predicted RNA-binding Zn ribbon-like protein